MFIRTMMRRAALFAAAPLLLAVSLPAHEPVRPPETDVPPTEADQRFKTKYGVWPPHITAEKRAERERAAVPVGKRSATAVCGRFSEGFRLWRPSAGLA